MVWLFLIITCHPKTNKFPDLIISFTMIDLQIYVLIYSVGGNIKNATGTKSGFWNPKIFWLDNYVGLDLDMKWRPKRKNGLNPEYIKALE